MKKTIILKSTTQYEEVTKALIDLSKEDDIHEVSIRPFKSVLSSNQRRLYWLWMRCISKHTGYTEEECHLMYKEKYLVPIFEREDKDYALMIEAVRDVHREGKPGRAKHFKQQIIKMTSIMDAKTPWMSEYLDKIREECSLELKLQLPLPEDLNRY